MILGLTGGSGTGKSTASEYFRQKGFIIIDSDKIAREVCSKGEKCLVNSVAETQKNKSYKTSRGNNYGKKRKKNGK